eukprot:403374466
MATQQQSKISAVNSVSFKQRFKTVRILGKGSFGAVYEVVDYKDNKVKALKVQNNIELYKSERGIMEMLERFHVKGVPKLYDSQQVSDRESFILMSSLGPSIYDTLEAQKLKKLPIKVIAFLAHQLIYTLESIHKLGIVHCDLKPNNILISKGVTYENIQSIISNFEYDQDNNLDCNQREDAKVQEKRQEEELFSFLNITDKEIKSLFNQQNNQSCTKKQIQDAHLQPPTNCSINAFTQSGIRSIDQNVNSKTNQLSRQSSDLKRQIFNLIDFGLTKSYKDMNGKHLELVQEKMLCGNRNFMSLNHMMGYKQSRRDDLESLFYNLLYLADGQFPWSSMKQNQQNLMRSAIFYKTNYRNESLFRAMPHQFTQGFAHIKQLSFDELPDYQYLRDLMIKVLKTPEHLLFQRDISKFSKSEYNLLNKKSSIHQSQQQNFNKSGTSHLNPPSNLNNNESFLKFSQSKIISQAYDRSAAKSPSISLSPLNRQTNNQLNLCKYNKLDDEISHVLIQTKQHQEQKGDNFIQQMNKNLSKSMVNLDINQNQKSAKTSEKIIDESRQVSKVINYLVYANANNNQTISQFCDDSLIPIVKKKEKKRNSSSHSRRQPSKKSEESSQNQVKSGVSSKTRKNKKDKQHNYYIQPSFGQQQYESPDKEGKSQQKQYLQLGIQNMKELALTNQMSINNKESNIQISQFNEFHNNKELVSNTGKQIKLNQTQQLEYNNDDNNLKEYLKHQNLLESDYEEMDQDYDEFQLELSTLKTIRLPISVIESQKHDSQESSENMNQNDLNPINKIQYQAGPVGKLIEQYQVDCKNMNLRLLKC